MSADGLDNNAAASSTPFADSGRGGSCDAVRPLLSAFADRECTPEEKAFVDAHLATGCADCSGELRMLSAVRTAVVSALPGDMLPPADLFARIAAHTYRRPSLWERIMAPLRPAPVRIALGTALAAGLAAVVVVPRFAEHRPAMTTPPLASAVPSSPETVAAAGHSAPSAPATSVAPVMTPGSSLPPADNTTAGETATVPEPHVASVAKPAREHAGPSAAETHRTLVADSRTAAHTTKSPVVHQAAPTAVPPSTESAGPVIVKRLPELDRKIQQIDVSKPAVAVARLEPRRDVVLPDRGAGITREAMRPEGQGIQRIEVPKMSVEPTAPRLASAAPVTEHPAISPSSAGEVAAAFVPQKLSIKLQGTMRTSSSEEIASRGRAGVLTGTPGLLPIVTSPTGNEPHGGND